MREEADTAMISVTDTGGGIPAEELPRLFERFHRVENQRSRSFEGGRIEPGIDLLTKPFTYEQVASRVREILDR